MTPARHPDCNLRARKLHEIYISFFLVAVIIGLLAVRWGDVPKLLDYLNFALTLASLLLAVLAIVYAVFSTSTMDKSLSELGKTTEDINDVAGNLSSAAEKLGLEIKQILDMGPGWTTGLAKTQSAIEELRDITLSKGASVTATEQSSERPVVERGERAAEFSEFFTNSSLIGQFVLYAAAICHERDRALDLQELGAAGLATANYDYLWAYLVASSAAGYLRHQLVPGVSDRIKIVDFPAADSPNLRRQLTASIAGMKGGTTYFEAILVKLDGVLAKAPADRHVPTTEPAGAAPTGAPAP